MCCDEAVALKHNLDRRTPLARPLFFAVVRGCLGSWAGLHRRAGFEPIFLCG
jgi:hypothetical protein